MSGWTRNSSRRAEGTARSGQTLICAGLAIVLMCVSPAEIILAGTPGRPEASRPRPSAPSRVASTFGEDVRTIRADESLFDDLAALGDPGLEEHRAAGLSDTEVVLVVVFLIVFFPVGIILLIIFLVDDD